jgi:tRNA modification GTPase
VALDLDGFPFILRDTAGLRGAASPIEQEGIRRALAAARDADIVLALIDASAPHPVLLSTGEGTPEQDAMPATPSPLPGGEGWGEGSEAKRKMVIAVLNKIDLVPMNKRGEVADIIPMSAKTGEGLDALKAALIAFARENYGSHETPLITRARHRQEIERARSAVASFLVCADGGDHPELAAEHLREAADALARLTGHLDVEDVLGQIFSEFCIGK